MIPIGDFAQDVIHRRLRDSQRSRVYRWEREWLLEGPEMTLDECRALVEKVCRAFGRDAFPRLKDGRGTRRAKATIGCISLPRWARRPQIVLHETAHTLLPRIVSVNGGHYFLPPHGPEFVRLLIELLVRYHNEDRSELTRLARKEGIKVGPKALTMAIAKRKEVLNG